MDFHIATAILIFLSLYLHTDAKHDEHKHKHGKFHKHLEGFKQKKYFHNRVPVRKSSGENVSEKLNNSGNEIPVVYKTTNITTDKNEDIVEQTINSQEIIRKNEVEMVNSTELNSQVEKPSIVSAKIDDNGISKEYVLVRKKDCPTDSNKIIKEVIFIRGIHDIQKLLNYFDLDASEEQISQTENHNLVQIDIPEESSRNVTESRKLLGAGASYQESKEVVQEESIESNQRNQLKEKEISGEEIESEEHVITKTSRTFGEQQKHSGEEIDEEYYYVNSKPNTIKKYIILKDENPIANSHLEVEKYNGKDTEKLIETKTIEKHIINKNNSSSFRKNLETKVVPVKNITTSNQNVQEYIVTKNTNSSAYKQLKEESIDKNLNKYDNSKENIKMEEHMYERNMDSEPASIEKYIYIEDKYPSLHEHLSEESVTEEFGRKYGIQTHADDDQENEMIRDYIVTKNINYPSQEVLKKESEENVENTYDNNIKQKVDKVC